VPPIDLTRDASLTYDVVTIGNALVDVIAAVEDRFLVDEDVVKGSMTLVDADRSAHLFSRITDPTQTSGGSAANTAYGLASLGGRAGFIGKIAQDSFGDAFSSDMKRVGVGFHAGRMSQTEPTGRCIIAVTPDGQRSMSTFLGAASLLDPDDISREAVQSAAVVFLEGYLFDRDHAKEAFRIAAKYAHEAGRKVSLTLSDSFCVDRHREDFMDLILNDIDILFCNEFELMSLYQVSDYEEALGQLWMRLGQETSTQRVSCMASREACRSSTAVASVRCRRPRSSPTSGHDRSCSGARSFPPTCGRASRVAPIRWTSCRSTN